MPTPDIPPIPDDWYPRIEVRGGGIEPVSVHAVLDGANGRFHLHREIASMADVAEMPKVYKAMRAACWRQLNKKEATDA